MRGSRHVAVITVSALVATLGAVQLAPPAAAASPGVATLVSTLTAPTGSLADWTKGLGGVGKLANALPAVQTSPGGALDFTDLLSKAFTAGTTHLADAVNDGDLNINEPITISGGRTGTLTSSLSALGNGDKQLDFNVDITRTLQDEPLSVALPLGANTNAPQSSFSSTGGIQLTVHATLAFSLVWDHVSDTAYFLVGSGSPTPFTVDATAQIHDAAAIKAAIGVLGVSLAGDSTLSLSAHFVGALSDPDNDGRLAFTNTDHSAGELAQAGSLAGLVSFGFASPPGALNASLHLTAASNLPSGLTFALPAVDATIGVSWPDISTGTPTITPTGLDTVGKFLNMTPRDLADGLGQLITSLTTIQRAPPNGSFVGNLNLPFLKGSLADAIAINESIKQFLHDNTRRAPSDPDFNPATDDPAQAGNPTFVSIQELLDRLNSATGLPGGANITISDVGYDAGTAKLAFKLTVQRDAPGSPVDLNAQAAAASGGAGSTYTATTLTDAAQHWTADQWVGRHVVAGTSGGTVLHNTATTLTLDADWTPATPGPNAPYTISGAQGDVGIVSLGNALQSSAHGIANANAVNATAKVTPSYHASITLVLDLQDPIPQNPPLEQHNPDGTTSLINSLPTASDRLLVRTSASDPLFTADFPIDAGVDLFANAGFLQVELKGAAHICKTSAGPTCTDTPDANEHMLQVGFKNLGDVTFGTIVDKVLHAPSTLLDFGVHVRAAGNVAATVPQAADFFGSGTANASFHWNDLTQATGSEGPQFDTSDLSELVNFDFDPSNPKALFSIVLKTLQTLDSSLGEADAPGASIFNQKIPLVGRSLRDLLRSDESGGGPQVTYGAKTLHDASRTVAAGDTFPQSLVGRTVVAGTQVGVIETVTDDTLTMSADWSTKPATSTPYVVRSELDDAISLLQAAPSDNLQALIKLLDDRLSGTPVKFEYKTVDGTPSLVITLDWHRSFHTSSPVQFDFHLPLGDQKLAGVQGTGSVSLTGGGAIKIGLVVPLQAGSGPADAAHLKILNDSHIGVNLDASVDDAALATTIGPLSLSLGDPTSSDSADKAQAKASYSLDLAKPSADGSAETFSDFLGDVAPTLNSSSSAVTCPGLASGTTDLAMCATLPLFISTDGGTTYSKLIDPGDNAFELRLPKDTTPGDLFDLTGAAIDGNPRLKTPDATELGNAIASHLIDFTQINGIDSFLNLLETSLNAASFGGKLPLIGDDLQQGADFIGNLRAAINDAIGQLPGDGTFTNTSGVRDWVNDKLAGALSDAGLNPDLVKVDTQCSTTLPPAPAPTLTPDPTGGGTTIKYAVVAYVKDSSDNEHDANPGPEATTNDGPVTLDSTHKVGLSWGAVTGADGYKVYREVSGNLELLKDVGSTTSYTDDGTDTPSDAPTNPSGPNPRLTNCSYSDFDAVLIRVDVSEGNFDGSGNLTCPAAADPHHCLHEEVPLNVGVPGLSLRADQAGAGPAVDIGWHLHLAFGISRSDGFFVDTKDEAAPEFAVGLNFTLPSDIAAQLAFINITAHNCTNSSADHDLGCGTDAPATVKPLFSGTFSIDLKNPADPTNGRMTITDLSGASLDDLFDVKLKAEVAIDTLLKAKAGDDAGFPGIQAEFRMHWKWVNAAPGSDGSAGGSEPLSISFDNVAIDAGAVFGHIVGPIIKQIKTVTGPLEPVIKQLYAPIPVLSDLSHLVGGDDVTLVSIAKAFSTLAGGPDLTFVDRIAQVISVVNSLPDGSEHFLIPIGSFQVAGPEALDTTATPDNTGSLISGETLDPGASGSDGVLGGLDDHSGGADILKGSGDPADSPTGKAGFEFPVFQHPGMLFNLIMGGDVTLVTFDSGPLTLGFDWHQEFGPVYAPPPVVITLSGSASVTAHIKAGFDTFGIRKVFEKVRNGESPDFSDFGDMVLQGLFFATVDDDGKPLPVVTFRGEIAAGAAVTAVIITVGIEGGVGLEVSFLWNDPNNDGKFRISEFLQAALNNPICLFTVSGRLFVFLRLYITIGFGPFSVTFSFTIADVTLLDFSATPDCDPPPPQLGGVDGDTLVVFAAALGHSQRGDPAWDSDKGDKDTVKVTSIHDFSTDPPVFKGVAVDALGIHREFLNAGLKRVIVDGIGYDKPMNVTFTGDGKNTTTGTGPAPPTASFELDSIVFGGSGPDVIKTGIGSSYVDGGDGNDVITTGDHTVLNSTNTAYLRPDAKSWVAGGTGDDNINVGNGDDVAAGDSAISAPMKALSVKTLGDAESGDPAGPTVPVSVPDWTAFGQPGAGESATNGKDKLTVGLGADTAFGNGNDDILTVGADNPLAAGHPAQKAIFTSKGATLVGGTGNDNIGAGSGDDTIYTSTQTATTFDGDGAADPGSTNIVDTGTGSDKVYGGTGIDRVTGHSTQTPAQSDDIRGGAGQDILIGGFGTDKIYGGPDDDYVLAEPSTVDIPASPPDDGFGPQLTVTHQPLPAGVTPAHKLLVGGLGRDHIVGGDGGADVYGDKLTSPCVAGSPVASDPVSELVDDPLDGNDKITGGAGIENIRAGGGDDTVDAAGNNDLACGEKGVDTLQGGSGADQVWGGSGDDTVYGDSGNDSLYGNAGKDTIYGGDNTDTIEGNADADWISGGTANDVIIGGTQATGRDDVGDQLYGESGDDTIIGDNGANVAGAWIPLDLVGTPASAGGGDLIYGGPGADLGFGGLANDTMFGGTENDHFEGNNASDTIYGESGDDELVGGSFQAASAGVGRPDSGDTISGGDGADVITGDNAVVTGTGPGTDVTLGRGFTGPHTITLLDLGYSPTAGTSGDDVLHGDGGTDVIYGQGGADTITGDAADDYAEGGPGTDTIAGGTGADDLVGGSSTVDTAGAHPVGQPDAGDTISGGDSEDVVIGDNGKILRGPGTTPSPLTQGRNPMSPREIDLYDLAGSGATAAASGNDLVTGDAGVDVILGQGGNDRLKGNDADDYVEGDQGSDWLEGDFGDDDLVGGSSTAASGAGTATVGQADMSDALNGGPGDDVAAGDNALVLRIGARSNATDRIGSVPGTRMALRNITLFDLNGPSFLTPPSTSQFGDDRVSGGSGVDVLYGQDGADQISGGAGADYAEGNGGADVMRGDLRLFDPAGHSPTSALPTVWPGAASVDGQVEGAGDDGQDDLIGGSPIASFRDLGDSIEGDGGSDFQLGDNGTLKRTLVGAEGSLTEQVFVQRYSNAVALPADATVIRSHDPAVPNPNGTTRFCTASQATCEPVGASGADSMWGDSGADSMWGQDGTDTMSGGTENDDMYGELGNDVLFGDPGKDVILGDRGGAVDELINPDDSAKQFTVDTGGVPKEFYTGFRQGSLDHRVDLLHDVDGDHFVGTSSSAPMPHAGLTEGGDDRIRGGTDADNIHAGFGDDLANGDSGGDLVFGDDGSDALWGGQGCDRVLDAATPDCLSGGVFTPSSRGTNDRFVDHIFGGTGGTSASSAQVSGSDLLDWRPRGTPATCSATQWPTTVGNQTHDPCAWFQFTGTDDDTANPASLLNNQHHQGTDWMYGGWDRDVMQGDVAANGPNPGDRQLDWNGSYNLYSVCSSSNGGFNDVRQQSPAMQTFLQKVSYGDSAGQSATDSATAGTSAYRELALAFPGESAHSSGSAYPTTPGHFDVPACAD
jgi:Ca2+-binding RTX toxin-like protein